MLLCRAISSEVEHYLDTVGVTGSIPVSPIEFKKSLKSLIVVIGLGRSGIGAANLLHSEGYRVIVLESCKGPEHTSNAENLRSKGIKVELGKPLEFISFKPWLDQLHSVVISPGVPWNHNTLIELRKLGITIKGEMSLAWERLKNLPWIGITGTNGKTTVTHMLNHVLEANQLHAPMGGNMGNSNFHTSKIEICKF